MTFNEKLKQALAENHNERMSRSTAVEKKHRFSLAYKLWERKILHDLRRNRLDSRWTLHKAKRVVTTVTIVAAIVLSMTACAVVKLAIGRFSFDDKRDYSKLFIDSLSSDKTRIEECYGLPEEDGWEITNYGELTNHILIEYTRGDESVTFSQEVIHGNIGIVNTENAIIEPMSLYEENDGFLIFNKQNNICALYWIYDGYFFEIMGNLNKDELVNLAHSTKIQNIL